MSDNPGKERPTNRVLPPCVPCQGCRPQIACFVDKVTSTRKKRFFVQTVCPGSRLQAFSKAFFDRHSSKIKDNHSYRAGPLFQFSADIVVLQHGYDCYSSHRSARLFLVPTLRDLVHFFEPATSEAMNRLPLYGLSLKDVTVTSFLHKIKPYTAVYANRRIGVMAIVGFSAGLPLAMTGSTLQAWMTAVGLDLRTIGIFSLVGLPYTLKFLWSPLMDRFIPPFFGRRRGWMLCTQLVLMLAIGMMAGSSPKTALTLLAFLALVVAFASASQDIVIDAYRTDVLEDVERGAGAAVYVAGYRVAMLVSGGLALILSDRIGFRDTYMLIAGMMVIGMVGSVLGPEPKRRAAPPSSLKEAIWGPLLDFFSRRKATSILLLIILYKLGDAYAGSLTTAFLMRGVGFSLTEIGTVYKALTIISVVIGAALGGSLMVRLGLYRSLLLFGILQAVSNLSFMALAWAGKSYSMMIWAVAFENLSGGMGTAAFVSLLMSLCNQRYSATQFALLSSLAVLGRVCVTPTSGFLVTWLGWSTFFFLTALSALPGLLILVYLRREVDGTEEAGRGV
jgi:MFS transporter, PAT family, beta-lactamase induction signal transducer AmpG